MSPAAISPAAEGGLALTITPFDANRRSILVLFAEGFSVPDTRVTWYVDGAPASSAQANIFDCSGLSRGDTVRAVAVVQGREVRSNEVKIGNAPPALTEVAIVPVLADREETLAVSANATDPDGDPVTITCAWFVNDVLAGNGPKLAKAVVRGDSVRVEVVAHDGRSQSAPVVMNHTIANHPPVFVEHQDYSLMGNTYVYQAQATDADGDRITYSLDAPSEGMSIDQGSGRVTWNVPNGFRGDQSVTVIADDGHGGTARYPVTFTIRE